MVVGTGVGLVLRLGQMVELAARKMQRGMQVLLKAWDCGESAALVTILIIFCASGTGDLRLYHFRDDRRSQHFDLQIGFGLFHRCYFCGRPRGCGLSDGNSAGCGIFGGLFRGRCDLSALYAGYDQ